MATTRAILVFGIMFLALPAWSQEPPPDFKAGQKVDWEGWSFRWQMRQREGLVLTDVHFQGRQMLKYIGLAEAFTVYAPGEPRILDLDDEGMGARALDLRIGPDCYPGAACNAFLANGKPATGKTAQVMMHEEPLGIAYAGQFGRAYGKMLVLWSMSRFPGFDDGYTFLQRWKFRTDGSLIVEIGATGTLQHPLDKINGKTAPLAHMVGKKKTGEKVFAPAHMHSFYYRIDPAIDGPGPQAVEEFNYTQDKKGGSKVAITWTRLPKETSRVRNLDTFRSWRVVNTQSKNALGHLRSYHLIPGNDGTFRGTKKEKAAQADLVVTRYRPSEFPRSKADPRTMLDALPSYLNDEPIDGAEVVLWYNLNFCHFPRTEDWFHQPLVTRSFEWMPRDFLDGSPLQAEK